MSAAAKLFQAGTGARNLMIAVVLGAGALGVLWLVRNRELFDPTSDKNLAYTGVNKIFGLDPEVETIGTKIFDWFHPAGDTPAPDEQQQLKSCRVIYQRQGFVRGDLCRGLIDKYGP